MKKLFFALVVFFMLFAIGGCTNEPTLKTAAIMAQDHVKQKMSYPEEVDFKDMDIRGSGDAKNGFIVYEKFIAPNAFGVKKEFIFKCNMKYLGGDIYELSSWECSNLIIEDTHTGQQWH